MFPDGRFAYVTNSGFAKNPETSSTCPSTVSVLDLAHGEVIKKIEVGVGANGVTIDLLGRRGYVANMRSNSVSVIDLKTHSVISDIAVGAAPAFVKLSRDPTGRKLVVTNLADASHNPCRYNFTNCT